MRRAAVVAALLALAGIPARARAEWRPPDLARTTATTATVLAAVRAALGAPDARFAERRERWTYAVGTRRLPVRVAVRGDDVRATVAFGEAEYAGGRTGGVRWRADANGIAHATRSDDQGDAADRLPESVFPFALADCTLAGESTRFGAAWVLVDRPPRDRPHWLYVDETTGRIVRETTREGQRTIVTRFEDFAPLGTMVRPRRWHVTGGDAAYDMDVTVDDVEPAPLHPADVAMPQVRRTFTLPAGARAVQLPAHFRRRTIVVDADLDGTRGGMILDTGTASIMVDSDLATQRRWPVVLEHATVPRVAAGAVSMSAVSTLAFPFRTAGYQALLGILGYDFFAGHVVHLDYAHERVDVLAEDAAPVFEDGSATVLPASFAEGIPIVSASFGPLGGDRFTLDSGSPHLYVLAPFAQRYAREIAATWPPARFPSGRATAVPQYLEGSIVVDARRAPSFALGAWNLGALTVGVEAANDRADAIDIALDGIVGTDEMAAFEWWFDYDRGRIAVRRNGAP